MGSEMEVVLPLCYHKPQMKEKKPKEGQKKRVTLPIVAKWKIPWWRQAVWDCQGELLSVLYQYSLFFLPRMTNLVYHEDVFSSTLYFCLFSLYVSITPRLFTDCLSLEGLDSGCEGGQRPPFGRDLSSYSVQNSRVIQGGSFHPVSLSFPDAKCRGERRLFHELMR